MHVYLCSRFGKYRKDERLDAGKWKPEETHASEEETQRMRQEQERYTQACTHTQSELISLIISL